MLEALTTQECIARVAVELWHPSPAGLCRDTTMALGQTSLQDHATASTTRPSGACAGPLTAWVTELKPAVVTRWVSSSTIS